MPVIVGLENSIIAIMCYQIYLKNYPVIVSRLIEVLETNTSCYREKCAILTG